MMDEGKSRARHFSSRLSAKREESRLYTSLPGKILMPACPTGVMNPSSTTAAPVVPRALPSMELEPTHVLGEAANFSAKGTDERDRDQHCGLYYFPSSPK